MKKNPISQATVVPAMEQAKLFTLPQKSDMHHTGKPRKGSLQYHTREIIDGKEKCMDQREREREHVSVSLE